jgi:hypothetical protein
MGRLLNTSEIISLPIFQTKKEAIFRDLTFEPKVSLKVTHRTFCLLMFLVKRTGSPLH